MEMTRALVRLVALPVLACGFLAAGTARAQTFSPGELSKPHASIDGLENCKKCHVGSGQPGPEPCLACHKELGARIKASKGMHGRMTPAERQQCAKCHPEHQGRDFALIDWGATGRDRFDHAKTGYPLKGKHAQAKCNSCHDKRRITDESVRALLVKDPKATTFLGLETPCKACHFDEHRGQEGPTCEKCHNETSWKPAPGFDHVKAQFVLTGKHQKVKCEKCHPSQPDTQTPADAFPAPVKRTIEKLKGLQFAGCIDCHVDFHKGKFGKACESCHVTDGWLIMKKALTDVTFHDKTRYPLRGSHITVPCAKCHGPFPAAPARFKNMDFQKCQGCHYDAHLGQLQGGKNKPAPDCDRCHTVEAFKPVRFEVDQHAQSRYPLQGAHKAVACSRCHKENQPLVAKHADEAAAAARAGKAVKLVPTDLKLEQPLDKCESCHSDVHAGQFAARTGGCASCHQVASFKQLKFDHNKDSRFALAGKHAKTACASCHKPERVGEATVVRFKPMRMACADCHRDIHLGQLAQKNTTDCARCHGVDAFKPSTFNHGDKRFTDFALEGKHAKAKCDKCHPDVKVEATASVRKYKGVPRVCETCHVDVHRGAFAGFDPRLLLTKGVTFPRQAPTTSAVQETRCAGCHSPESWDTVSFPHERTGFPLRGAHQRSMCKECHVRGFDTPLPDSCASCHRDTHQGEFGLRCEGCHKEDTWQTTFTADAHRRTAFPLFGRHALIPCTECHRTRGGRGFEHITVRCYTCHEQDYRRASLVSINHVSSGFGTDCRNCHSGMRFSPADFPAHAACFRINNGPHANMTCENCHKPPPTGVANGACQTNSAACSSCHAHSCARMDAEHADKNVAGYQCKDRKCYECHKGA
jgi:hypothetical protein